LAWPGRKGSEADSGWNGLEDSATLTKLPPREMQDLRATSTLPLRTDVDEAAARRSLRRQIARLERELAALFTSAHPRQKGLEWGVQGPGGPRLLDIGALEAVRDDLAARIEDTRGTLTDRTRVERRNRERIDEMVAAPDRFKWVRISNEDVGEPGCKHWHSRPRLGLIGMLMGWWRVKISSGCP
jgi:hypothetical protein